MTRHDLCASPDCDKTGNIYISVWIDKDISEGINYCDKHACMALRRWHEIIVKRMGSKYVKIDEEKFKQ